MTASAERPRRPTITSPCFGLLLVIAALATSGCGDAEGPEAVPSSSPDPAAGPRASTPDLPEAEQRAMVEQVVREVFWAMTSQDCARLEQLVGGAVAARMAGHGGCAAMLEEEAEALQMELVAQQAPRRDGRDPSAWMVPVVLRSHGRELPGLLRVRWTGDAFLLVHM